MKHDFDSSHSGQGCEKDNHIMSYGNSKEKWSSCSKKDFAAHYLMSKDMWCMEGLFFIFYQLKKELLTHIPF